MSENKNPYGAHTTGHLWDDNLAELTNQPPKWWMLGLHASWMFVVLYSILYPTWPMITTHTKGVLGWTAIQEYKEDLATIEGMRAQYEGKITLLMEQDIKAGGNGAGAAAAILADDELSHYVERSAKVLFGDNCAACHGTKGSGNPGYPILVDDEWLYGGSIAEIHTTIYGGRQGMMPKMGGAVLSSVEVDRLATAILAGKPTEEPLFLAKGCIGCHGMDGKGNKYLGSANLTDAIYRFEATDQLASIKHTIKYGVNDASEPQTRGAVMPKFIDSKLSESDITKLAVYVHKLGGGQ